MLFSRSTVMALGFAGALVVAGCAGWSFALVAKAAAIVLALAVGTWLRGGRRTTGAMGLATGAVLAGLAAGAWHHQALVRRTASFDPGRIVWVRGWLTRSPESHPFSARITLRAAEYLDGPPPANGSADGQAGSWLSLGGSVRVELPLDLARQFDPGLGCLVAVRGLLRLPEEAPAPGAFSLRRYLWARQTWFVSQVRSAGRIKLVEAREPPLSVKVEAAIARFEQRIRERLGARLRQRAWAWTDAVAFGRREALGEARLEALRASGLIHLVSVSGVHVALLSAPLLAAVRRFGGRSTAVRWAAAAAATATGWAYALMAGLYAPAVRSATMQSLGLAAWLAGRRVRLLDALAVAAALQLAAGGPWVAVDPGFQMSYAATAGIGVAIQSGAVAPDSGIEPARRRCHARAALRRLRAAILVSFGAWAAVCPLVALYTGQVAALGALLSLPTGPLGGALLWGAVMCAGMPDWAYEPAAWLVEWAAWGLETLAEAGSRLQGSFPLALPPWAWALPAAAGLAGAVHAARSEGASRGNLAGAAVAALCLFGLGAASGTWAWDRSPTVVLHPLGRSGWLAAGTAPSGDAWAVASTGGQEEREAAGKRAMRVLAALGAGRADLWLDVSRPGEPPPVVGAGALPGAGALGAVHSEGIQVVRGGQTVRTEAVRVGDVRLVWRSVQSGAPGALLVQVRGYRVLELDLADGCLAVHGARAEVTTSRDWPCARRGSFEVQMPRDEGMAP